jgi:predicted acyl esterase
MRRPWLLVALLTAGIGIGSAPLIAPTAGAATPSAAPLVAGGSVNQVWVTGAPPGAALALVAANGSTRAQGHADPQGALLFRNVAAGAGYHVAERSGGSARSGSLRVLGPNQTPAASFYRSQQLGDGYGYLTTRDGTKLAVNVHLPGPPEKGPYPTVVEYSGYDPANPDGVQPASRIAQFLGYATVGVNMRGTGCSGGAWDYFEPLQSLDGYDAIETIAAQPWVLHGAVGMVGISFPGISQLFVAATRPPHLAAVTPMSVIDDTYRGTLYPGGILNTGFAVSWGKERQHDALPAGPGAGQPWARERIAAGDTTCRANQTLHSQAPNVVADIRSNRFYVPSRLDHLNPDLFVNQIKAPTFLVGQLQDDQTGGRWPELIAHFNPSTPLRVTIQNGTHVDSFDPDILTRWGEFLDFYVARRIPSIPAGVRAAAPANFIELAGMPVPLPPDRFAGQTNFAAAFARYRAEAKVRILFDNGAGGTPGAPIPGFEASFATWPPPSVHATTYYLRSGNRLDPSPPARTETGSDQYRYDPSALPATDEPPSQGDIYGPLPNYDWRTPPVGASLTYTTAAFAHDVVLTGPASADLWLRSSAPDTDLEVTLTEVRADGKETYVQSGWLRASQRTTLNPAASTPLEPQYTFRQAQTRTMPNGRFTLVRVPLFPIAHAFRAGSRVRLVIQAPGGNRPFWAFETIAATGNPRNDVAHSPAFASKLVLPVATGIRVPTPLPPCPALRGEPCRAANPTGGP